MSYLESKIISLNASDGDKQNGSYLSNINFNTINLYKESENTLNTYIEISSAQIPVSFYIINYTNNIYKIKIDTDPIETYTVPTGNYNATQLITLLNTYHANLVATFNKITGKITFTHNRPFIIYNNFISSIGTILGFDSNTINTSIGTSNPYTLTPPNLLNLMGIKKLNIFSSDLEIHNITSGINNNISYTSLIGVIPNDAPTYGLINYHNYSNIKCIINNKSIDSINLQIKDETNNYINFNNISFTITLILHVEKKINPLNNIDFYKLLSEMSKDKSKNDDSTDKQINPELDLLTN